MNTTTRADRWTQQERQQLIDAVEFIRGPCSKIYLVGSRLIGWFRQNSDFDVVIEHPEATGQRYMYETHTLSIICMPSFSNCICEKRHPVDNTVLLEGFNLPYLELKTNTLQGVQTAEIDRWLAFKRQCYVNFDEDRSFNDLINEGDIHVE